MVSTADLRMSSRCSDLRILLLPGTREVNTGVAKASLFVICTWHGSRQPQQWGNEEYSQVFRTTYYRVHVRYRREHQ